MEGGFMWSVIEELDKFRGLKMDKKNKSTLTG